MLLLLLGSVSLAYLTTIARRIEVDGLAVSLSRHWLKDEQPASLGSDVDTAEIYYSDSINTPTLIVASLRPGGLRSSDEALARAMRSLKIGVGPQSTIDQLRLGSVTAHLFTGWDRVHRRQLLLSRLNLLALVTDDDRRYWIIYMSTIGGDVDRLTPPLQLLEFREMLNSIEIK